MLTINIELLNKVKKALFLVESDTFADDEIKTLISGCREYLLSSGLNKEKLENNSLVESITMIYVKTFYGFKNDGSVRELPNHFHLLVRQLLLSNSEVN